MPSVAIPSERVPPGRTVGPQRRYSFRPGAERAWVRPAPARRRDRSEPEDGLDVEVDLDRRADDGDAAGDHLLPVEREGRRTCGYGSGGLPTCMITV